MVHYREMHVLLRIVKQLDEDNEIGRRFHKKSERRMKREKKRIADEKAAAEAKVAEEARLAAEEEER